jgi:hypothetical protein
MLYRLFLKVKKSNLKQLEKMTSILNKIMAYIFREEILSPEAIKSRTI